MKYSMATLPSQASATRSLKGVVGMTTKQYLAIEAGPSRDELTDAFKYACDEERDFKVTFTALQVHQVGGVRQSSRRGKFTARIIGLRHDDGSGQSFIIDAYVSVKSLKGKLVKLYYCARTRTGYLEVA